MTSPARRAVAAAPVAPEETALPTTRDDRDRTRVRVAVVGAGLTGLTLVHELARRDVPAIALEAAAEPGGVVRSRRVDGRVVELGPQRIRLSPPVRNLVADLGIDPVRTAADGLWTYVDGRRRRVPTSVRTAVGTDLLSLRGKARALLEPLTGPPRRGESVRGALRRMVGREAADRWLAPLYASLYGSDPASMPAEHSLRPLFEARGIDRSLLLAALRGLVRGRRPPVASFEAGLGALPAALYRRHADRIALSTPVEAVRPTPTEPPGDDPDRDSRDDPHRGSGDDLDRGNGDDRGNGNGDRTRQRWRVETADRAVLADRVVVTAPAGAAADVLEPVARSAAALGDLRYSPVACVFLALDPDRNRDPEGLGCTVPRGEGLTVDGVTYDLFDRDLLAVAVGGDRARADPDRLIADARRELPALVGADPAVDPVGVVRWPRAIPARDDSFAALDRVDLPDGIELATNYVARAGLPGRIRQARQVADRIAGDPESGAGG